jgi:hypothetical protein
MITNRKCTYCKTLVGQFKNSSQKYDFPSSNDSVIKIRKETGRKNLLSATDQNLHCIVALLQIITFFKISKSLNTTVFFAL